MRFEAMTDDGEAVHLIGVLTSRYLARKFTVADCIRTRVTAWRLEGGVVYPEALGVVYAPNVPLLLPDGRVRHACKDPDGTVHPIVCDSIEEWVHLMTQPRS